MTDINTSPVPTNFTKPMILDFYEAFKQLAEGKLITRIEWNNKEIFGALINGKVVLHKEDGFHIWVINDGDLIAKDWIVLEGNTSKVSNVIN